MMTMYEKLMMLPIFKGISDEALMSLIEKAHLHFDTHDAYTLLVEQAKPCESLICVLSGDVEVTYSLLCNSITIKSRYDAGKVLGLDHLFGMDTRYSYSVKSLSQCGTMELTKSQYLEMLGVNNICLINFLNYLSYRIQRMESAFENFNNSSCMEKLVILLSLFTERNCNEVIIEMKGQDTIRNHEELSLLKDKGLAEIPDEDIILVPSRNNLLDFAEEYLSGKNH